jgi:two-component system sensor histidine kinase AlgZ
MGRFTSTLAALATPRRSLPIAVVVAALVAVQVHYSGAKSALVPVALAAAFLVLAPWSWRRFGHTALGMLAYGAEAAAIVALLGIALPRAIDLGPTFLTDAGSLVIAGVLYAIGGWGLGRDIELELDLEHAKLKAIKTHLDPHFLFNTINAIAEWCREDPKIAEDATLRLAEMLRDMLEALERRTWPLERELSVARGLLELHRVRDPDAFTVTLDIVDPVPKIDVPTLVLVALVENAVKHGPRKGHQGPIVLRVSFDPLRMSVENPGPYASSTTGRGIAQLEKQLALTYGARARFDIREVDGRTHAAVTVTA